MSIVDKLNAFSGEWGVKGVMDTMNVGGETGCRCFKLDNTTLSSMDTVNFHQNNTRLLWIELLPYGALSNNKKPLCNLRGKINVI